MLTSFRYWWTLAVVTMLPMAYIDFQPQITGLFFISFILGTLTSELFFSGRLSDWIMDEAAKKRGGPREPEDRLWLSYPAALLSTCKYS